MTDERLSEDQVDARLEGSGWKQDNDTIVREVELENFQAAIDTVNKIGALAEAANHHPDILIHGWNNLKLTLSTHDAGGLTPADFDLAGQIDMVISGTQEAG